MSDWEISQHELYHPYRLDNLERIDEAPPE